MPSLIGSQQHVALCAAFVAALCILPSVLSIGAEVILDTKFGAADTALANPRRVGDYISGVVPTGWRDDSILPKGSVKTAVVDEEGKKFLRYEVDNPQRGIAQIVFKPFPVGEETDYYCCTFTVRNLSLRHVRPYIRPATGTGRVLWTELPELTGEWQTFIWYFQLKKPAVPLALWLEFFGSGKIDLAALKFERLTNDELAGRWKESHAAESLSPNLFRNSRFPLGLPSGWSVRREDINGPVPLIQSDPKIIGPTGSAALAIYGPNEVSVLSEPFAITDPVSPHQVTVDVKGSGKWSFAVSGTGDWSSEKDTELELTDGDDWKRIAVPFQPQLKNKVYALRIQGSGKLWIDGLRAALVSQGNAFAGLGECEVALALPESETSIARIQFSSEVPQIRYVVTGHFHDAQLKVKVFHVDGSTADLPPVSLPSNGLASGTLNFGVFPNKSLGVFRVEAWAERSGQRISPPTELVITRIRQPRYWRKDAPDSHFGAQIGLDAVGMTEAKAIGLNWVRCHGTSLPITGWAYLEKQRGEWSFPDAAVDQLRAHHLSILGQLATAPPWASYRQDLDSTANLGASELWFQPKKLEDWTTYVRKVVEYYRGKIDVYDVWNDPVSPSGFAVSSGKQMNPAAQPFLGSPFPQRDYANLLIASSTALKESKLQAKLAGMNPQAQSAGSRGVIGATDWIRGVLDFKGWPAIDIVSYHDYSLGNAAVPSDTVEQGNKNVMLPLRQRHPQEQKPVWITDAIPAGGRGHLGFYHQALPFENRTDSLEPADQTCRYFVSALSCGVDKVMVSSMAPGMAPFVSMRGSVKTSLTCADGYVNPGGAAVANLAWHVDGLKFDRRIEVAPGVYAYLFDGLTSVTAVLALKSGSKANYVIPTRFAVSSEDLFGNPLPTNSTLGQRTVYLTAPAWFIDIAAVLQGRRWIFNAWFVVAVLALLVSAFCAICLVRRRNSKRRKA